MSIKDLYKASGVDAEKGDSLVEWLQSSGELSNEENITGSIVDGIGGFAGLFKPNLRGFEEPLLVASTDGVGTKLLLGLAEGKLKGLGIDLVAMCVNDLYCIGARPMFFVDYYATGVLDQAQFKEVLTGIKEGLAQCLTPLLGGETAELPGLYAKGHFDLAGFVVGVVDGKKRLGPHLVTEGDLIYALPSSGFHSNGFSLVRKWLAEEKRDESLIAKALVPTIIYDFVPDLYEKIGPNGIHAIANITGGGISGNLPRVLPAHLSAKISFEKLPTPDWMKAFILRHTSKLLDVEPVFNMGAGMIVVVSPDSSAAFEKFVKSRGRLAPVAVGKIVKSSGVSEVVYT